MRQKPKKARRNARGKSGAASLIVLLALLAVTVGLFVWQNQSANRGAPEATLSPTVEPSPTVELQIDPNAGELVTPTPAPTEPGVAIPGWAVGTYLGGAVGNLLTPGLLSALSVGLYGMFLAVILPPARKDKKLLALILVSMALSYTVRALPGLSFLSDNMKTIVLTVGISLLAAVFFPIREAKA